MLNGYHQRMSVSAVASPRNHLKLRHPSPSGWVFRFESDREDFSQIASDVEYADRVPRLAAAAGVQPCVEQARNRGVEFHGQLTRPDGAQPADIAALVDTGVTSATVTERYPNRG